MKCPKCDYVSHDYLDACRKCHKDLVTFKQELHLEVLHPGELDLGELLGASWQGFGGRVKFSDDNSFFGGQRLGGLGEADDNDKEEFDIELDNRTSEAPPWRSDMPSESRQQASMTETSNGAAEPGETGADPGVDNPYDEDLADTPDKETQGPGELTKMFYVPEDLTDPSAGLEAPNGAVEPGETGADPGVDNPYGKDLADTPDKETQGPGGLTKMFYVPEDLTDPSAGLKPSDGNVEPDAPVQATDTKSSAGNTLHISIDGIDIDLEDALDELEDIELDTSELDQGMEIELDLPAAAETPEVTADLASNDLATDELVLEMEEADDDSTVSAEHRTTIS
jgi:hypothetical protein